MPKFSLEDDEGTGFCLDAVCRFIVTNYHVAMGTRIRKINGVPIIQRYLATGANDQDATIVHVSSTATLPFTWKRDLAIYELQRPLNHYHGLNFSLDELEEGQEVDVYGYSHQILRPLRSRKLMRFSCSYKGITSLGLLAFDCQSPGDLRSRGPGASGGIVVDRKSKKIVGILSGGTDDLVVAVPIESLADFVKKVLPFEVKKIFPVTPEISPVSQDIYPKFLPQTDFNPKFVPVRAEGLQHRQEEPYEIRMLRQKAQEMADGMRNLIAVQSLAWGSGKSERSVVEGWFEVRVIGGVQKFREYPDGKKELDDIPAPPVKDYAITANQWFVLPQMVGTELNLKITQDADVVVNKRKMKVFRYYSSVEDDLCPFQPIDNYLFFKMGKIAHPVCYGEVWMDEDWNITRISENLDLSDKLKEYRGWEEYRTVVTYDWLKLEDEPPRIVPKTIFCFGRFKKKEIFWCRGSFTNYRMFTAHARILPDSARVAGIRP